MPRQATGGLRALADGWEARITIDDAGTRRAFWLAMPGCKLGTAPPECSCSACVAARERCSTMAEIAVRVRRAGHAGKLLELLKTAGRTRGAKGWDRILAAVDALCTGVVPLSEAAAAPIRPLDAPNVGGVYFLRSRGPTDTAIKIGHAGKSIRERVYDLRTAHHHRFDAHRLRDALAAGDRVPLVDEEDSHAESPLLPMEALAQAALSRGSLVTVRDALDDDDEELARPQPSTRTKTDAVVFERFNLHAGIRIAANDDIGRERSCRYLARPPFALGRIRKRRDGLVGYRVKKVSRHKTTERVMSPVEFLARIASIVAPPRFPLVRLHGVFGARHAWRARVVPKPLVTGSPKKARDDAGAHAHANNAAHDRSAAPASPSRDSGTPAHEPSTGGTNTQAGDRSTAFAHAAPPLSTASLVGAGAECVAPNVLSLAHGDRLDSGDLYAAIDGQSLLRRTFDVDLRVCARCGGRTFVRAVITEPHHIERILDVLRRQRDPPAAA